MEGLSFTFTVHPVITSRPGSATGWVLVCLGSPSSWVPSYFLIPGFLCSSSATTHSSKPPCPMPTHPGYLQVWTGARLTQR